MPSEENIMSINKIIGVKREKKKGTSLRKRGCSGCTVYSERGRCVRGVDLDHSTTWLSKAYTKHDFFPFLMPGRDEFLSL